MSAARTRRPRMETTVTRILPAARAALPVLLALLIAAGAIVLLGTLVALVQNGHPAAVPAAVLFAAVAFAGLALHSRRAR